MRPHASAIPAILETTVVFAHHVILDHIKTQRVLIHVLCVEPTHTLLTLGLQVRLCVHRVLQGQARFRVAMQVWTVCVTWVIRGPMVESARCVNLEHLRM